MGTTGRSSVASVEDGKEGGGDEEDDGYGYGDMGTTGRYEDTEREVGDGGDGGGRADEPYDHQYEPSIPEYGNGDGGDAGSNAGGNAGDMGGDTGGDTGGDGDYGTYGEENVEYDDGEGGTFQASPAAPASMGGEGSGDGAGDGAGDGVTGGKEEEGVGAEEGWDEMHDEDGNMYYYHAATGESTWECPWGEGGEGGGDE
jgi:hypothetical protein